MKKLWQNYVVKRKCKNCNTIFHAFIHNVKRGYGKYCSRACRNTGAGLGWKKGHGNYRTLRGIELTRQKTSGKNHWNWQGGITPLIRKIRNSLEYKKWTVSIHRKCFYKCVLCKNKKRIEVDHYPDRFNDILKRKNIKTFKESLLCKELWNVNNGRTLCYDCHKKNYKRNKRIFVSV